MRHLFVPQLFLGIEFLRAKNPEAAIPFLEKAEKLNPNDLQAALNLGKAYVAANHADHAAEAYSRAAQLAPNDGSIWLSLGTAYLQQVEDDARIMTSRVQTFSLCRSAGSRNLCGRGKAGASQRMSFKAALAHPSPAPLCPRGIWGHAVT